MLSLHELTALVHRSLTPHLLLIVFLDSYGPDLRLVAIRPLSFAEPLLKLQSMKSSHVDVHLELILVSVVALRLSADVGTHFIRFPPN